jgi:S-adenosylmethionine:tRNA ribosyltransferase-isomerase
MNPDDYNYSLPDKNLALSPSVPRDSSKLLVYDTASDLVRFDRFHNLSKYLGADTFMVLNDTKVLPARVTMKKQSGGKVVVLFLVNEIEGEIVPAIVDRKINVGEKIYFENNAHLEIQAQKENIFELKFGFSKEKLFSLLAEFGTMPIPPYLKKTSLKRDELLDKYQTIFALNNGSSAAPTASLHFTEKVFKSLKDKDIEKYFITLHVGLGTFAPLTDENLKQKKLHEEYYSVSDKALKSIKSSKDQGKKLVAVGTTVTRTLESLSKTGRLTDKTDLFIYPPYEFKMVDHLITNFHLPKSSLMMLVEAFLQHKGAKKKLVELYNMAIENDFRFYSFGDAMLIL